MGIHFWIYWFLRSVIAFVGCCFAIRMHCDDLCVAGLQFQQVSFQVNIKAKASASSSTCKIYHPQRSGWANYILLHSVEIVWNNTKTQLTQSTPELCVATQRVYLIFGQRNSPAAINSYWIQFVLLWLCFRIFLHSTTCVVTFAAIEATWFVWFRFRQRMREESNRKMWRKWDSTFIDNMAQNKSSVWKVHYHRVQ